MKKYILISIDVEDWFQVENFKSCIPFSDWPFCELRVEKNTHRLLDILDQFPTDSGTNPKATFFILGWLAERLPALVREIRKRGHEVASHGYCHNLCNRESYRELTADLKDSKKLLEDITGEQVAGYRAPSFSINADVLKLIEDCGYLYDSSYNSFGLHGRYGHVVLPQNGKKRVAVRLSEHFYELPVSNLAIRNQILPWGGGGYFRMIPFPVFRRGITYILKKKDAYVFYMHPWEIDPDQPRLKQTSASCRFRHYVNLRRTENKLSEMLTSFRDHHLISCRQYLEET